MKDISLKGIGILVIVGLFTFGAAFGVDQVMVKYGQVNPLEQLLKTNKGIKSYEIQTSKEELKLHLELQENVDLKQLYVEVLNQATDHSKGKEVKITFENAPKEVFEGVLFEIEPILYEGLVTGKYTWMIDQIDARSAQHGFRSKLQLDDKALYLVVSKDDQKYYQIIPRV